MTVKVLKKVDGNTDGVEGDGFHKGCFKADDDHEGDAPTNCDESGGLSRQVMLR